VIQVVCIKQVADTETRVRVAADGRTLDPAGVTWILNPYDEFAVEQALRIKEAQGSGEVVVICLGAAGAQATLRNALAMGADRGVHLKCDTAPDPLQVARALAEAIRPLGAGIVWCGRQAVDDDAAAVGPMLAELLGVACVTSIAKFELAGSESATVERDIEGGREVYDVTLPALFTADKGLNEPRYASLKGIMAAKKKPVEE
jgi:electron transfer flavoprotein beta subunit